MPTLAPAPPRAPRAPLLSVEGCLGVLATPSSYLLLLAALGTVAAKAVGFFFLERIPLDAFAYLWAISLDLAVYLGIAASLLALQGLSPWWQILAWPLAGCLTALALANAWYLVAAGEQLRAEDLDLGVRRLPNLASIARESLGKHRAVAIPGLVGSVAVPALARRFLRRCRPGPGGPRRSALLLLLPVSLALLVRLGWPSPRALPVQELSRNPLLGLVASMLRGASRHPASPPGSFEGYRPPWLVRPEDLARAREQDHPRPNIVVLVLESLRHDYSSLAGSSARRGTGTPALAKLAGRGLSSDRAYAVVPHTTKSLFSLFCGRYPLLEPPLIEILGELHIQCLPGLLGELGYRTAFFQSARGDFEQRPRLVDRLGFEEFAAWEDIRGQPLGYLASDDESLGPWFAAWLDDRAGHAGPARPFLATLLTSATHHPYRLSARAAEQARREGRPTRFAEQRYALLVEAMDRLVGEVIESLHRHGLGESTLVLVLGDHGEGFGANGVRIHDNNFYDEGLRVPLVLAGPGVPAARLEAPVSLADVVPTILDLVGLEPAPEARQSLVGTSLLRPLPAGRRLLFSCWHDGRCRGFVAGARKVVQLPATGESWLFDLRRDPGEREPLRLPEDLRPALAWLEATWRSQRTQAFPLSLGATRPYATWRCEAGHACTHLGPPGTDRPR